MDLHSLSPNDFGGENSSSLTQTASKWLTGVYGISGRTCAVRDSLHQDIEGSTESIFQIFIYRLRIFKIYIELSSTIMYDFDILSFLIGSTCISLTSPATFSITTHPLAAGSRLQRVDINFNYSFRHSVDGDEPHKLHRQRWSLESCPWLLTFTLHERHSPPFCSLKQLCGNDVDWKAYTVLAYNTQLSTCSEVKVEVKMHIVIHIGPPTLVTMLKWLPTYLTYCSPSSMTNDWLLWAKSIYNVLNVFYSTPTMYVTVTAPYLYSPLLLTPA